MSIKNKDIKTLTMPDKIYRMLVFGEKNDVKRHYKWHRFQTQEILPSKDEVFEARDLAFEDLQKLYPVKDLLVKRDTVICYNSTNNWTITIMLKSYTVLTPRVNQHLFGTIDDIMRGKYLV